MTSLPSRAVASLASSTVLRSGGTSAISWLAASIRNLGFEVRAGGPRRSQASSLRIRFCRLASVAAACRSRSTRCSTYAAYPPSNGSTIPSCTSQVVVGDLVEKPPVVGHQQQPADVARPALLQMAGQPGDALDVQVVGGLVERDHVPFAHQQPRQLHPSPLAAAERGNRCVPSDVGHQPADDVADPRVAGPLVFGLVADQRPADGVVRVEGVGLAQRAHPQSAAPGDPAGVRRHLAGQQPQQTRLAVAVASHDADARAVVDPERDRLEDHLGRVFEVDGLGSEQVRHWADASRRRSFGLTPRSPQTVPTARKADHRHGRT